MAAELAGITGEHIEHYGHAIFAQAAADLGERSAKELLTTDFKEFTVRDTKFAIGTVETASPSIVEKRSQELLHTMRQLAQERGYSSFLFMIVDIINLRSRVLISHGEHAVAEVLAVPLEQDGHSVVVENLVSRKNNWCHCFHAFRLRCSLPAVLYQPYCKRMMQQFAQWGWLEKKPPL